MPLDLIRDSFVGQLIYYSSGRRILRHPEDKPTFSLPARYSTSQRDLDVPSETATLTDQRKQSRAITNERGESVPEEEILRSSQDVEKADTTKVKDPVHDTNLVTWYGPDDPDYPQNVRGFTFWFIHCTNNFISVVFVETLFCHLRHLRPNF